LVITGEDNCLLLEPDVPRRLGLNHVRPIGDGEIIRDWICVTQLVTLWPNSSRGERLSIREIPEVLGFLWPYRTALKDRKAFGVPVEEKGIPWWALRELYAQRLATPLSLAFAFVATHNHFVLDRGGKVFNRSAPIIKLPTGATEDDHLTLLGLLNSSTACFWMKQVFDNKSSTVDERGARQRTMPIEYLYEYTGTGLSNFPIPEQKPISLPRLLDQMAREYGESLPDAVIRAGMPTAESLAEARARAESTLRAMIAAQEELDWQCYHLYGLADA